MAPLIGTVATLALLFLFSTTFPPYAMAAIDCNKFKDDIPYCMLYLHGKAASPHVKCCSVLKAMSKVINTQENRVDVCECIRDVAGNAAAFRPDRVMGVNSICGVKIPTDVFINSSCVGEYGFPISISLAVKANCSEKQLGCMKLMSLETTFYLGTVSSMEQAGGLSSVNAIGTPFLEDNLKLDSTGTTLQSFNQVSWTRPKLPSPHACSSAKLAASPASPCCSPIKALNKVINTQENRMDACDCIRDAAGKATAFRPDRVMAINYICGVKIPTDVFINSSCVE
ncbi:hypothetical protein H6P81_017572 [Aristolochia fimbriata]|uniref:Bifunctional inhibitor/plant lipid transfer protein/seed storage helical domain-containing protein n=1 Tax=Aristolochia fimbriata TaxID=158543 RepID=A0AAV7DZB6_ARIFI|nr:hypothetical protein H6P81_017572 [Aristolochia fimbriata]